VVPLLEAVLGSRIIKTIGEQRRPENKGNSAAGGLKYSCPPAIPTRNDSDISIVIPESTALFFHAILLFAIVLKLLSYDCTFCIILSLKYMRTLTFLIVNITLNPEHVSSTL